MWLSYSIVKDQILYKVLYSKKPMILHLQLFHTKYFIYILEKARPLENKLQLKAKKGQFIRYIESTKIFKVYISSKGQIIYSSNIYFPKSTNSQEVQSLLAPILLTKPTSSLLLPATIITTSTNLAT